MADQRLTVLLRLETHTELTAEAARQRVALDDLADTLIRRQLAEESRAPQRMQLHDALATLDETSARMPRVDAVRLIREGRDGTPMRDELIDSPGF